VSARILVDFSDKFSGGITDAVTIKVFAVAFWPLFEFEVRAIEERNGLQDHKDGELSMSFKVSDADSFGVTIDRHKKNHP